MKNEKLPLKRKNLQLPIYTIFFLSGLLIGLFLWDVFLHIQIKQETVYPKPFTTFQPSLYPSLKNTNVPAVNAEGVIIMDADSHVILYAKNSDVRFSPASTTKMMTAIVALHHYDVSDVLTTWDIMDTEGSGLNLVGGEQMTLGDLLYGALVDSANDAAYTIAENYPGGMKAFLMQMNERAQQMLLYNTYFSDPAGLDDDDDYTTPKELVTIADAAMQNPIFRRIVSTKEASIESIDKEHVYQLENTNELLGTNGVDGIKTGTTAAAGEVLVTSASIRGHRIYIVVMKSDDRFADTLTLLNFLKANLRYRSIRL